MGHTRKPNHQSFLSHIKAPGFAHERHAKTPLSINRSQRTSTTSSSSPYQSIHHPLSAINQPSFFMMSRRVSDSSTTTNSSFSSDSSFSTDSSISCCPAPIDLRPYKGKQSFSTLVELSQQGLVSPPTYTCLGAYGAAQWLAKVAVMRGGLQVEGQGFAASKASAKSAASKVVLAQLSGKSIAFCDYTCLTLFRIHGITSGETGLSRGPIRPPPPR
jgi:hypothetical protein